MKITVGLMAVAVALLASTLAQATVLRVIVVQPNDTTEYVKALAIGQALLKSKGSAGQIRVWRGRYAGENAGRIVVSVEYPSLEALAKDDALFAKDAQVSAWLQGLNKIRKIVSDSIYDELKP